MSEANLQLTRKQQEILLRGLRFVRSSVALDMHEYTEESGRHRQHQYAEISSVESIVSGAKIVEPATV